ncbi:hypothetical protein HME9302_00589 [Alteripontixanthobacter maritimus]|uniref:Bacteriophage T5 Orf172 DNA-binding domain-containing protein n=2 Tax=Alteripontixanthobacter maritimus TaxID=2161824 RepID=A0A369Q3D8_9SPHN|nr:hypothetical protein HME9302_00589 [Alteripontixanthobacter maritimus]
MAHMAVYFILEENDADWRMKIGRSCDPQARGRALQTGNSRPLKLVGWINDGSDTVTEARLHAKYARANVKRADDVAAREWFYLEPADILSDLIDAGRFGFVAKNADAFEIVGYDRDAVPEYVGVWDWANLEIDECCPFCGCFCGMHFQEASWMYHCPNCDTLTDFEGGGIA